jgi:hypothetical protein
MILLHCYETVKIHTISAFYELEMNETRQYLGKNLEFMELFGFTARSDAENLVGIYLADRR